MATTTGILAALVRNVSGERALVTQMVPDGADSHSWEPSLRAVRDVAYADLALTNYLLLEEHAIIRTLDANLPTTATSVSVAEEAAKQGATILPLVEDRALDTAWLGLRVMGDGAALGATRASTVDLTVTGVDGPGDAAGYLTTSFGSPEIGFATSDGFDRASGFAEDTSVLPADAHQHMSWAFTEPGVYRVRVTAALRPTPSAEPVPMGSGTVVFAVGAAPDGLARDDSGSTPVWREPGSLVMRVTDDALMDAPTDAAYSFLGAKAGERYYVVPQTQNPSVIWLGWNTQDPAVTQLVDRGVTMSIGPVQGPGKSWLFLQNGVFGEPLLLVDGQRPTAQDVWVDVNTHVHANWVFSKPGIYLARATFSADTLDGRHVTASAILRFAVGSATDPSAALAAQPSFAPTPSANETGGAATASGAPEAGASPTAGASGTAADGRGAAGAAGLGGGTAAVVASLVVLALAGGAGLALRRRRLIAAEERRAREEAAGSVAGEAATGGPDAPDAAGAGEGGEGPRAPAHHRARRRPRRAAGAAGCRPRGARR